MKRIGLLHCIVCQFVIIGKVHFYSSQSGHGLEATIAKEWFTHSKISLTDLAVFPPFLRFDMVRLMLNNKHSLPNPDAPPIGEICQLFESQLQSIKPTLDDSYLIFYGVVDETDPASFHDHTELVTFLRNRLLTICDKSRRYSFNVYLKSDVSAATKCAIISSILQMPQIVQCSNVSIRFWNNDYYHYQLQLPVEEISKWLINRKLGGKRMRSLLINYFCGGDGNMREMFDHLKKVLYFIN